MQFIERGTCKWSKEYPAARDEVSLDQQRDVVSAFGLDIFCQFEARGPKFEPSVQCTVYTVKRGGGYVSNSGTLPSNRQNIEKIDR